jgi:hypothetical protein
VKANVEVAVQPFSIPHFVRRDKKNAGPGDPDAEAAFELSAIDAQTLSALCDQFRADVFKKAGKTDPRLK